MPADGSQWIATLQINDTFLLGLQAQDIDWEQPDRALLSRHLYRVQKLSSSDYFFRRHRESRLDGKLGEAYQRIQSLGAGKNGWQHFNPIKITITPTGKPVRVGRPPAE